MPAPPPVIYPWVSSTFPLAYCDMFQCYLLDANHWEYTSGSLKVHDAYTNNLTTDPIPDYPSLEWVEPYGGYMVFSSKKNYQYITQVENFYTPGTSFSITSPWSSSFLYDNYLALGLNTATATPASPGNGYLYFYSSPTVDIASFTFAKYNAASYTASNAFGMASEGILSLEINEIDFNIQGYSFFRTSSTYSTIDFSKDTLGWAYSDNIKSYTWIDSTTSQYYPCAPGGTSSSSSISYPSSDFRFNNNLNKLIPYAFFNLSFIYQKLYGGAYDGINIYLSPTLPYTFGPSFSLPSGGVFIASITQSYADAQFYGLQGNQYLLIVANTGLTSSATYSSLALSNVRIDGGYYAGNNRQFQTVFVGSSPDIILPVGITSVTYSAYVGVGNTINATQSLNINRLFSKIGNGLFKAGIWENGVWNSGWRYDENVYEFYEVGDYYDYGGGLNWRFIISGPPSSVSKFSIGDKVSIGNIVAIDINEDRKLIKNYFTIIGATYSTTNTSPTSNYIIVEIVNKFPLRRIERDSVNHRIYVTKNVWLSGAFLNGYFKGIWNYGLFKGYPLITEMFQSHWIDGIFDGGHFNATQSEATFVDTIYSSITVDLRPSSKVGLTFSAPHMLNVGDIITIDKDDKTINPQYDGEVTVLDVPNEYQIITDLDWGSNSTAESGSIYTQISNGLVQNFDFRSHNISNVSTLTSLDSDTVFVYNSWIDVNFNSNSAVNIAKPYTALDATGMQGGYFEWLIYSQNNLYGYPTNDVLSSKSKFRDSFSARTRIKELGSTIIPPSERIYKLGTKYKIFSDYIGDSSKFEDYFGSTGSTAQLFLNQGWTYSSSSFYNSTNPTPITGAITFSRTTDSGLSLFSENGIESRNDIIAGKELKVEAMGNGGVLSLTTPTKNVRNRNTNPIEKGRYTVIEFDLLTYSVSNDYFELEQDNVTKGKFGFDLGSNWFQPIIHFNNINTTTRNVFYPIIGTYSFTAPTVLPATYLPIYQNIDHLSTTKYVANGAKNIPSTRKYEYFYGKTSLAMHFKGSGLYGGSQSTFIIDNLNFFEIDMVPFFQYFIDSSINKAVQIPYQGIAPFIDYANSNFSFLDNISIGFDSVSIVSSSLPVSGVGTSIGGGIAGGGTLVSSVGSVGGIGDLYESLP
jgi:hypothetical protein